MTNKIAVTSSQGICKLPSKKGGSNMNSKPSEECCKGVSKSKKKKSDEWQSMTDENTIGQSSKMKGKSVSFKGDIKKPSKKGNTYSDSSSDEDESDYSDSSDGSEDGSSGSSSYYSSDSSGSLDSDDSETESDSDDCSDCDCGPSCKC